MGAKVEATLFILILIFILSGRVQANRRYPKEHILKTIKGENGDVIDCLNIYKQPALNHPLLKNHSIEIPKETSSTIEIKQTWQKSGSCPRGTIPVLRSQQHRLQRTSYLTTSTTKAKSAVGEVVEAMTHSFESVYRGAKANIYIWNPFVDRNEYSLGHVAMYGTGDSHLVPGHRPYRVHNLISTGWAVYPIIFKDSKTRYFVYWTKDNGASTGCYNLDCPGFVQISNKLALGAAFENVSIYQKLEVYHSFALSVDQAEDRWYAMIDGEKIGYWPTSIFDHFWDGDAILWGGIILNSNKDKSPTRTQMGSGHFSGEGDLKAAKITNAVPIYPDGLETHHQPSERLGGHIGCYDVTLAPIHFDSPGFDFYYGGPGSGSPNCQ